MELEECYKILEAEENDPLEDIYSRYLLLCKKYHPDMYPLEMQKMWATERFIIIDSAYKTILNTRIKKEEDKTLSNEILSKIMAKLDSKIAHSDRISSGLNVYLLGALVELVFMGTAVILLVNSFNKGHVFAYFLIGILVLGFIYLWRAMKS